MAPSYPYQSALIMGENEVEDKSRVGLVQVGDTKVILQIEIDDWPFPIPLIKDSTSWRFDSEEAQEERLNRIIGRNELDVMQVCLAYVDAQREYYLRNP
jgi:hypothetical protein